MRQGTQHSHFTEEEAEVLSHSPGTRLQRGEPGLGTPDPTTPGPGSAWNTCALPAWPDSLPPLLPGFCLRPSSVTDISMGTHGTDAGGSPELKLPLAPRPGLQPRAESAEAGNTASASLKAAPKGRVPWQGIPGTRQFLPLELPPHWVSAPDVLSALLK